MDTATRKLFSFEVKGLPKDTFHLIRFTGQEALSRLFRFEIHLCSENEIDLDDILDTTATLTFARDSGCPELPFHGIVSESAKTGVRKKLHLYRVVLHPKAWWLTLSLSSQIFLNKPPQDFLAQALTDGGLHQGLDFQLRLTRNPEPLPYVCQYEESHFTFLSRWMERLGVYYYFEHLEHGDRLVLTDSIMSHQAMEHSGPVAYAEPSALLPGAPAVVSKFTVSQVRLPKEVKVRDYHYEKPTLEIEAKANVWNKGQGSFYTYGEHLRSNSECKHLATVLSEEMLSRRKRYHGRSNSHCIRPGYVFELSGHPSAALNRKYVAVSVRHEGSQAAYLTDDLGLKVKDGGQYGYYNSFSAIENQVQFRAPLDTPWPRAAGPVHAKIDSEGEGEYADMDSSGRYKVIMPFDLSGRKQGKASTWLRMATPYSDPQGGLHLPLRKGTEVLVVFTHGDPDRPLIASTAPNPETPSPVSNKNNTKHILATPHGNSITLQDKEGVQHVVLQSPVQNSWVRIGHPNDPEGSFWTKEGITLCSKGWLAVTCSGYNQIIFGEQTQHTIGFKETTVIGHVMNLNLLGRTDIVIPRKDEITPKKTTLSVMVSKLWGKVTGLFGAREELAGEDQQIHGEQQIVVGEQQEVVGEQQQVHGEQQVVVGGQQQVVGEQQEILGEHQQIEGQQDHVAGEQQQVLGEQQQVVGGQNLVVGEQQQVLGEQQVVAGQQQQMVGEANVIGGAENHVVGELNVV